MKTVLVIDDEEICLEQIDLFLGKKYKVLSASTGQDGINLIKQNLGQIDLILLDLMLPDINGGEILKILKKDHDTKPIKVVMQTGAANNEILQNALKEGADAFILKPFKRSELLELVGKYI